MREHIPQPPEPAGLLDVFYQPHTIDCYTFVFNEQEPDGYYTMLATDYDGQMLSQWTTGMYESEGANEHLGKRVNFNDLGRPLVEHVLGRLEP